MTESKTNGYERRAKEYRDKAEDCRKQAKTTYTPELVEGLHFVAENYENLASQMDRLADIHRGDT